MDGVEEVLSKRDLNIQEVKECVQDSREWRSVSQGIDVMLVSFLCDLMMGLHGKVQRLQLARGLPEGEIER